MTKAVSRIGEHGQKSASKRYESGRPPASSGSSVRHKAQRTNDLSGILAAEGDVRAAEAELEVQRERLSKLVLTWLETWGQQVERHDRESNESYSVPHYGAALAVDNGVIQLFARRLRSKDGSTRIIGTLRRILTEEG